ncbi:hypothetical protein CAEBREN_15060 [Caenorhabditis brenneri]|uniref:G-protein coupled receptors family 1 profile domain-containing protein n=1 Tax=Caenorhabditis brenneri TaxID=135651 RepID=G0P0K0_CAEBE|nr:hypothetical protein CAEBREN_15060 [Caenorhabditis brenneri]
MRTSSTNVIMIIIAISDIFTMLTTIYKHYFLIDVKSPECVTSSNRYKLYLDLIAWFFQDHFRRCSSWQGVMMATVRLVIMRKMNNPKYRNWSRPPIGWCLMMSVFCTSAILSVFFLSRNQVVENRTFPLPISCADYQDVNSNPPFSVMLTPWFSSGNQIVLRAYVMFDAIVTKFIPCIAFPILTISLIRQLRKFQNPSTSSGRKQSVANEEKNELTTKLIVFMTFAFFIAEAPLGMIYLVKVFYNRDDEVFLFSIDIVIYFTMLLTLNSISHSIFCVLMSSQYRDSIRKLIGIRGNTKLSSARNKTKHNSLKATVTHISNQRNQIPSQNDGSISTQNPFMLEPPRSVLEQFALMTFVLVSTYLFLCRLSEKKVLLRMWRDSFSRFQSQIWQTFPQFCLLMTFIPITHFSFLLAHTFRVFIFSTTQEAIFRRLVPIVIFIYPILYIPPVPFAITMIYSVFLNCKADGSTSRHVFGLKPTYNKITVFVISMTSAIYFLRLRREERRFVYSLHLDDSHRLDFDMLRYIPIFIITACFLRRIYSFKTSKTVVNVSQAEYLYLAYIALFISVFWLITVSQFLLTILSYHRHVPSLPTRLLGVQDSCILQNMFIYSVRLAKCRSVARIFNKVNVYPRRF